ncbi:MAG: dienelactone hydrolase [Nocardioides sp.]|nr:dienelactone hydrolase [Nocardioides sp.]
MATSPTEILLLHHAQGRTDGVLALAERFREEGHVVHVPDQYDGHVFATLDEGIGYAEEVGFQTLLDRGVGAAEGLPAALTYVGISLGVMPAQALAQNRAGARGAVLLESCVPAEEFGAWPDAVPLQVHGMADDPVFAGEGDLDAARALVAAVPDGELVVHPGAVHLFSDRTLATYDESATERMLQTLLPFLARL